MTREDGQCRPSAGLRFRAGGRIARSGSAAGSASGGAGLPAGPWWSSDGLAPETRHGDRPSGGRARACRSRLAGQPPHVLVRRLLRPAPHGVSVAARDQRRSGGARPGLRHALASGHGDRHLRARRGAGAQGLHRHRLGHPPGRRAADERRAPAWPTASSTPRQTEPVHFLQIWLLPRTSAGLPPSYEQKTFSPGRAPGTAAGGGLARRTRRQRHRPQRRDGVRDAAVGGQAVELPLAPGRHAWVHVARGQARVAGQSLSAGDAAAISQEPAGEARGRWAGTEPAEVLVFDLG